MKTIETILATHAVFSDDGTKRYLLSKTWEPKKPRLVIVMLVSSEASGITLDTTTQLVLNNCSRLGYGSVDILNLFATVDDFDLKHAEEEDTENIKAIVTAAQKADVVVYAPGVGKMKSKVFQERQKQVLLALRPFEDKLHCLTNATNDARLQHPLSPAVRTWHLSPLKVAELLPVKEEAPAQKKKPATKGKASVEKSKAPATGEATIAKTETPAEYEQNEIESPAEQK